MPDTNTNAGMSDHVRDFSLTFPIVQPIEDADIPLVMIAPFDFELLRLFYRTQDGTCELLVYINDELVEWEDAETLGVLQCDENAVAETVPSSTATENYTVHEGDRLSVVVTNTSTHTPFLELQFDCRKRQVNDEGT